jgi:hypothetical protein
MYSTMEARLALASQGQGGNYSLAQAMFARDFNQRRYHQKGLSLKLPFRPLLKFAYMMVIRRAFLDGRAGLAYAFLQSFYEYLIVLKTRELSAIRSVSEKSNCSASDGHSCELVQERSPR